MVARLLWEQDAAGSSPVTSTSGWGFPTTKGFKETARVYLLANKKIFTVIFQSIIIVISIEDISKRVDRYV